VDDGLEECSLGLFFDTVDLWEYQSTRSSEQLEIREWYKSIGRHHHTLATGRCNVQIKRLEYKDMSAYEKRRTGK
jgi:hypothetical protein